MPRAADDDQVGAEGPCATLETAADRMIGAWLDGGVDSDRVALEAQHRLRDPEFAGEEQSSATSGHEAGAIDVDEREARVRFGKLASEVDRVAATLGGRRCR